MTPEDFAKKHLHEHRIKGVEIVPVLCPFCHGGKNADKFTFALNLEKRTYNCKRGSCGVTGTYKQLLSEFGERVQSFEFSRPEPKYIKPKTKVSAAQKKVAEYLQLRGISQANWEKWGVGESGGNIAFPYYQDGELVMVKFRKPEKYKGKGPKAWREEGGKAVFWGMDRCKPGKPLIICEGECFPGEAEVLTPNGWIELRKYNGDPVLQVDDSLKGTFVVPSAYINKRYSGKLLRVERGGNYLTETTPLHNIVYMGKKGEINKRTVEDMPMTIQGEIPTTVYVEGSGIPLTKQQIALCIAVNADGTIDHRVGGGKRIPAEMRYVRTQFKKERKITRLKLLLEELEIKYSCSLIGGGFTSICFPYPEWGIGKLFPNAWLSLASKEQRQFILEEIIYWDGNTVVNRNQTEYSTKNYHNAVFIQTLAHTSGIMSTVMKRENSLGAWYKVSILNKKNSVSWQNIEPKEKYYDGYVYCVTVPTGMVLVRQEGKITVSGNCDAMALTECGLINVVSVPSGAEDLTCIDHCWDWLERFSKVIIWPDNDEPGQEMCRKLIQKLGSWRCAVVQSEYKDANACLHQEGQEKVLECVDSAKDVPIAGLMRLADVKAFDYAQTFRCASSIHGVNTAIGGFMGGELSVWTGDSGSGKSTFLGQELLEAVEQGHTVCAYSGELPGPLFRYWIDLQAAGIKNLATKYDPIREKEVFYADIEHVPAIHAWYYDQFFLFDNTSGATDEKLLKVFEYAARRYDCKIFLIDNLMACGMQSEERELLRKQADFARQCKQFALQYEVHVHLVAHPRKAGERLTKHDVAGAKEITNWADNVFSMYRPGKEEATSFAAILDIFKSRFSGAQEVSIGLSFDERSKRFWLPSRSRLEFQYGWEKGEEK